jgi:hypothetical protein
MSDAATKRHRGEHGPHVLSERSQKQYLRALRDRALKGDPHAVALLLRMAGLPDGLDDIIIAAKIANVGA